MLVQKVEPPAMTAETHKTTFFRQSGWMMITTVASGGFMYAVHMVAPKVGTEEYAVFTTLLQVVGQMGIPAIGLQIIFAQQAASALHEDHERELAGIFRGLLRIIFFIWLLMAAVVFALRHQILAALKIGHPAALWMTVIIALWLGWGSIVNGVGRFAAICVIVLLLGGDAAGALAGVFLGLLATVLIGAWQNRHYWQIKPKPVIWRGWFAQVVPLTLGLGASTFMLGADMLFVQHYFDKKTTAFYAAAGMIGRALVYFTQPLAMVMFPKVVRSAVRAEKTDVLTHALGVTALAGAGAAIGCTLFPSLPIHIVYRWNPESQLYLAMAPPLVPWFAWCMLPLTLATVLINALLARAQFRAVPWLVAVAIGYGVALYFRHETFLMVIQTLGIFSSLMLGVCAWFTWGRKTQTPNSTLQS